MVVAMVISFGMVRWLTHQMAGEPVPDPVAQKRAILLRGFANDLTAVCNDLVRLAYTTSGEMAPGARMWIDRVYRRDIRFLEQRMDDAPMSDVAAYRQLRAAVQRCAGVARHPDDRALKTAALNEAAHAIDAVNAHIAAMGFAQRAGPAPRTMVFD
jgi:hypothetical protein